VRINAEVGRYLEFWRVAAFARVPQNRTVELKRASLGARFTTAKKEDNKPTPAPKLLLNSETDVANRLANGQEQAAAIHQDLLAAGASGPRARGSASRFLLIVVTCFDAYRE
jgi:hypothetical protein